MLTSIIRQLFWGNSTKGVSTKDIPSKVINASAVLSQSYDFETGSDEFVVPCLTPKIVRKLSKYLSSTYPLSEEVYEDDVLAAIRRLMIDDEKLINNAIMYGTPELWNKLCKYNFVYNRNNGTLFDKPKSMWSIFAAQFGYRGCLTFLHESGCKMDKWVTYYAAQNGHIDCLVYLHQTVGCELISPLFTPNELKDSFYLRACNKYVLDNHGTFTDVKPDLMDRDRDDDVNAAVNVVMTIGLTAGMATGALFYFIKC
jgi:hypothetical protein